VLIMSSYRWALLKYLGFLDTYIFSAGWWLYYMARARLFAYDDSTRSWEYTGLEGTVTVQQDEGRTLLTLQEGLPLFQTELYCGFSQRYTCSTEYFHYFPLECGTVALSFCNAQEAADLHQSIQRLSPSPEPAFHPRKHTYATNLSQSSEPNNGLWDTQREKFNLEQVPKDLKRVFRQAGIRKNELERRDTAVAVFEGLVQRQIEDLLETEEEKSVLSAQEDIDTLLDRQVNLISQQRKQTVSATQSQILHNIEAGRVIPPQVPEEQRLARLLASKIEERRRALHVYDSSGDSSESDWSESD